MERRKRKTTRWLKGVSINIRRTERMVSVGFAATRRAPSKRQSRWSESRRWHLLRADSRLRASNRPESNKEKQRAKEESPGREGDGQGENENEGQMERVEREEEDGKRYWARGGSKAGDRSVPWFYLVSRSAIDRCQAAVARFHRGRRIKSKNKIIGKRRNSASTGCPFAASSR